MARKHDSSLAIDRKQRPHGNRFKDMTGCRFGRLTVIKFYGRRYVKGVSYFWLCLCDCGQEVEVLGGNLRTGHTCSCGCLASEMTADRNFKHGLRHSKAYTTWVHMRRRCEYDKDQDYLNYGGRGIRVCKRWQSFANFYRDMGEPPELRSLDRIDNDGDYSPTNCRWTTYRQQTRNRRNTRWITHDGETKCLVDWAEHAGLNPATLHGRLKSGWSMERALSTRVS